MIELVAPAGDYEKLKTALYFGADAVYLSGKKLGLRAFSDNFESEELSEAVKFTHEQGKKAYVTVNIFAKNADFSGLKEYLEFLSQIKVDGVIVSDPGIIEFIKTYTPELKIHLSTQANTTNKYSARFWGKYVDRIVLARELPLNEIKEIHEFLPDLQLEAFVHGAMCISFSGRCLLSDVLSKRAANRGECIQACRYPYILKDPASGEEFSICEDKRGSYILNSKDLNMIEHLDRLSDAGITAFKIEGRAKSPYYAAGVVNAYRRALSLLNSLPSGALYKCPQDLIDELAKISHRSYTTGFYFNNPEQCLETSKPKQTYEFTAIVKETNQKGIIIEQRNRFKTEEVLEVLSPSGINGKQLQIEKMFTPEGEEILDANLVQQMIFIPTPLKINAGDILRRKIN